MITAAAIAARNRASLDFIVASMAGADARQYIPFAFLIRFTERGPLRYTNGRSDTYRAKGAEISRGSAYPSR